MRDFRGFTQAVVSGLGAVVLCLAQVTSQADAEFTKGKQFFTTGNYEKAIGFFESAAGLGKKEAPLYIARCYVELGKFPAAAQMFQKAIEANASDTEAKNDLGEVLVKLGELDKAKAI